jgi:hypothetical protein
MGNLHLKEDYIEGGGYIPTGEDFEKNYFLFAALADITVDLHRPHGRVFGFFAKTGALSPMQEPLTAIMWTHST